MSINQPAAQAKQFEVLFDKVGALNQRAQAASWHGQLTISRDRLVLEGTGRAGAVNFLGTGLLASMHSRLKRLGEFDPATMAARHDPKLHRLTLQDTEGRYWAILTNTAVLRSGDPKQCAAIASAIRAVCPQLETGDIRAMPTSLKWALGIIGGIAAVLGLGMMVLMAFGRRG